MRTLAEEAGAKRSNRSWIERIGYRLSNIDHTVFSKGCERSLVPVQHGAQCNITKVRVEIDPSFLTVCNKKQKYRRQGQRTLPEALLLFFRPFDFEVVQCKGLGLQIVTVLRDCYAYSPTM